MGTGMASENEAVTKGLWLPLPVPRGRAGKGVFSLAKAARISADPLPNPPPEYRERGPERRGFTLFELLIATAVVGLILASVVPFIVNVRETNRRLECVSNLKLIRDGLRAYLTDQKSYPRVRYDEAVKPEGWTAFTGPDAADPFAEKGDVKPNDVTASLWLLVRDGYVSDPSAFVCPSSGDWPDPLVDAAGNRTIAKKRGNFRSGHNLSYSVFCMFGSTVKSDVWTDTLPGDCVLLADKNPGGADVAGVPANAKPEAYAKANSRNHGRAGQNVLYASGDIQFERNPYVGVGYKRPEKDKATDKWAVAVAGDNIYTVLQARPIPPGQKPDNAGTGTAGKAVSPAWQYDSYLVPTAED